MQWHLGNSFRNQFKDQFEGVFSSLPKSSKILLTIGEIDCRLDNGIIKYSKKFPKKDISVIIETTVKNYITYVSRINSNYKHNIIIQGVPCPNINIRTTIGENVSELIKVIKTLNFELKSISREKGFGFLDVHELTDRGDGFSNGIWHIDQFHLSPDGVLEAWNNHITS